MFEGIVSIRTRIIQTSLYAALKTNGQDTASADGIAEAAIPAAEIALTRGLTMGQLIEELSRNLTLSLFSADRTWSPLGANTTVYIAIDTNIYAYSESNLGLAYGVTIINVIIGMRALKIHGVSHGSSFSSIMCSTRSPTLDDLNYRLLSSRRAARQGGSGYTYEVRTAQWEPRRPDRESGVRRGSRSGHSDERGELLLRRSGVKL